MYICVALFQRLSASLDRREGHAQGGVLRAQRAGNII